MKSLYLLLCVTLSLLVVISVSASPKHALAQNASGKNAKAQDTTGPSSPSAPTFRKAFVIDDRLSALRRKPDLQGEVIRRLRLGHVVYIVGTAKPARGDPPFCRVAVTRRTRGWIHKSALAVQGRTGEDQRIIKLIEASEGTDKITLCRLLNDSFSRSRFVPRCMLLLGEEAERIAEILSQRIRRRLGEVRGAVAGVRDYYLSDAGLDRYSKLGVVFDFNESTIEFVYDGKAYREVIKRFPASEEAALALQHLETAGKKTSSKR